MNLSPHFTLEELTATQHRGVDNAPPPEVVENLVRLCDLLEHLRFCYGRPVHVNSGYRSPDLNRVVGGQPNSQHCLGLACDFIVPGLVLTEAARVLLRASLVEYDQFIYEFGAWLHVSCAPVGRPPRRQALMIGKWTDNRYLPLDLTKLP